MIDVEALKDKTDLLALAERDTTLKRVATTGGGEWGGPCPFCGGRDRFRVQPAERRWLCRHCTSGKWQDTIAYVMQRDNIDFKAACELLGGPELPKIESSRRKPPAAPAYSPPNWQAQALKAIEICQRNLWAPDDERPLLWLLARGLKDSTLEHFKIGYSPGGKIAGLYMPRGIVIPCLVAGEVWYLKIRRPNKPGEPKYDGVKGNRTAAIFNADSLEGASAALFCEGEFDTMIAWQELGGSLPAATLGSATNLPDLATWGHYLLPLDPILASYDNDQSGQEGLIALESWLGGRFLPAPLPEGPWKDVNDYYLETNNIREWIFSHLVNSVSLGGMS